MDVQKLIKAAELIKDKKPTVADEINKIAQALGDPNIQPTTPTPNNVTLNQPQIDAPAPDSASLNPNIKNFGGQQAPSEEIVHKLTFTIAVPPNWGELEIMNELLPVVKTLQEKEPALEIKGYQFTQT